jgi:hypothetical protein
MIINIKSFVMRGLSLKKLLTRFNDKSRKRRNLLSGYNYRYWYSRMKIKFSALNVLISFVFHIRRCQGPFQPKFNFNLYRNEWKKLQRVVIATTSSSSSLLQK